MIIKVENSKIAQVMNLLYDLSLKGKQSRLRTKFINKLNERLVEYQEDVKALLKEHCHLDEEGNPKTKNDGEYWDIKDVDAYVKEKKELDSEEFVIEGGNYTGVLKTVKEILFNCEKEFSGDEAHIYDYICEKFEEAEEENE